MNLVLTIDSAFIAALPLDPNCWKDPAYLEQKKMVLEGAYRSQIEAKKEEHAIYIEGCLPP